MMKQLVQKKPLMKQFMVNDRHHGSSSDIWTPLNVLKGGGIIGLGFPTIPRKH